MNEGFFEALAALGSENSVEQALLVEKIEAAMLKAAQKTRQMLYGGQPVMAQIVREPLPESRTAYTVSLGGGEWGFRFSLPSRADAEKAAEQLPPCMGKLLLQIFLLTDRAADQTAEWISGI